MPIKAKVIKRKAKAPPTPQPKPKKVDQPTPKKLTTRATTRPTTQKAKQETIKKKKTTKKTKEEPRKRKNYVARLDSDEEMTELDDNRQFKVVSHPPKSSVDKLCGNIRNGDLSTLKNINFNKLRKDE